MAFVLSGLLADPYDRQYSDGEVLRRLWSYTQPDRALLVRVTILILAGTAASVAFPVLISQGVDAMNRSVTARAAVILAAAMLAAGAAEWVLGLMRTGLASGLVANLEWTLRREALRSVLHQEQAFLDESSTGGLVSRVSGDTEAVAGTAQTAITVVAQVLLIVVMLVVLAFINLVLTLVTLGMSAIVVTVTLTFRRMARGRASIQQRAQAEVGAHMREVLAGMHVAKNFGQEAVLGEQLSGVNQQWFLSSMRSRVFMDGIFPVMGILSGLATVGVVYAGGLQVGSHGISVGGWYLYLQAVRLFWDPLVSASSFWALLRLGFASGERVLSLIDREPEVRQTGREAMPRSSSIELVGVTFGYSGRGSVLRDLSLRISAGETVALVGSTGAGKTTMARLIARAYESQGGELRVGGVDVRQLDMDDYRRHLGIVPQVPALLSGTVAMNIRYPRPEASDADVDRAVCRIAGGEWLSRLAAGLDTPVGESGRNLSVGQRQLVALTRILLQDPPILILDEATASMDPLTDAEVQEGLQVAAEGRTTLIIAHRLLTIQRVERIVVLDGGRIVQDGSHQELLAEPGVYRDLYEHYFSLQR